ncbi:hypothetical protein [Streptacidiphilus pinicola]|uniref:hypothetical protein n=1 Tax=Streptacidiphilus pinicola TaxID=2219663 RepID=UPI001FB3B2F0|nr:hypothetical protein [Streptacidiphilus pinicola]
MAHPADRPEEFRSDSALGAAAPWSAPGSVQPRLNRPVADRYPQIRPTSGYGDSRIRRSGPGPGAGTDHDPERSAMLTGRLVVVLSVVVGQLWALGVGVDAWMQGHTSTAWWCTGFEGLSFLIALAAWRFGPTDH